MDVSQLKLRSVVLHSVPKAALSGKDAAQPRLSDVIADLDATKRIFLEEKIKETLHAKARPIVEDAARQAKAAQEIRAYLVADAADRDLIATSKALATGLYLDQPGGAPAGMVLVADMTWAGSDTLLLAKLDQEVGMRAFITDDSGTTRVNIQYLDDLFVTERTTVFKIGIFAKPDIKNGLLSGQIVDAQVSGSGVAGYFLQHFLGCMFSQRPQELTELFANAAQEIINSSVVPDAEKRARYTVSLISTLQSQGKELDVKAFAREHLDREDRDAFISKMSERGVSQTPFRKDIELVQSRLKRVQIETHNDVFILAPPERLEDGTISVTPKEGGEGVDRVEVSGDVKSVTNHS